MLKPITTEQDEAVFETAERAPSARWALVTLSLSMLMSSLDTSIANAGKESITGTVSSEVPPVTTLIAAVKKNAATKQSNPTVLMPSKTGVGILL